MSATRLGTARRVTFHEARRVFAAGGEVLVSEYGREREHGVYVDTTTHTRDRIGWGELVAQVRMWSGRYPYQRFYVVERLPVDAVRCSWDAGGDPVSGCDRVADGGDGLCMPHRVAYAALCASAPPG